MLISAFNLILLTLTAVATGKLVKFKEFDHGITGKPNSEFLTCKPVPPWYHELLHCQKKVKFRMHRLGHIHSETS